MTKQTQKNNSIKAQDVFFPAACLAAIVLSTLSQTARMGITPWAISLTGIGHAHELLFGFVLALISGYTLGKIARGKLVMMLLLWLLARISYLMMPGSVVAAILNIGFALWVVWHIAPRFLVAKKWRNRMIAPLLVAIFCFPLGWFLVRQFNSSISPQAIIQSLLILLIMLMTFIAGRMLAPALAGAMQLQGYELKARVQPRIEAGLLILPPLASIFVYHTKTQLLAASLLLLMAILIVIRMIRWQFWRCPHRSDLMTLIVGYNWLLVGILFLAYSLAFKGYHQGPIHLITMGAIGTLSSIVILKYSLPKRHHPAIVFYSSATLLVFAVASRLWADGSANRDLFLLLAVVFWSSNYLLVLSQWLRTLTQNKSKSS